MTLSSHEQSIRKAEAEGSNDYLLEQLNKFNESLNMEHYKKAKNILNKYFGEENNQIAKMNLPEIHKILRNQLGRGYNASNIRILPPETKMFLFCCNVIIRFPEVKITNGEDRGHTIKDLWVKFDTDENFGINNLEGTRSFMTYAEAYVGYRHSHLRSRTPNGDNVHSGFTSFCKGTGEINQVMKILNIDGFDEINFTLFCLHLKNFVEWESIEGRPYINYSSVYGAPRTSASSLDSRNVLLSLSISGLNAMLKYLKHKMAEEDDSILRIVLNPIITNDQATLEINDELSLYLANKIQACTPDERSRFNLGTVDNYLCKKTPNGTYESITQPRISTSVRLPTEPLFEFKGNPIYLTIDGLVEQRLPETVNIIKYAHPKITEQFSRYFSSDFTEVLYRNEEVIKSNSLENFLQTTGSNLLPMRSNP